MGTTSHLRTPQLGFMDGFLAAEPGQGWWQMGEGNGSMWSSRGYDVADDNELVVGNKTGCPQEHIKLPSEGRREEVPEEEL